MEAAGTRNRRARAGSGRAGVGHGKAGGGHGKAGVGVGKQDSERGEPESGVVGDAVVSASVVGVGLESWQSEISLFCYVRREDCTRESRG